MRQSVDYPSPAHRRPICKKNPSVTRTHCSCLSSTMSYIKPRKSQKRKRGREPMVEGDLTSAKAVTHTKVTVMNDDGTTSVEHVLESLDNPRKLKADPKHLPPVDYDMHDMHDISYPENGSGPKTYRVRKLQK